MQKEQKLTLHKELEELEEHDQQCEQMKPQLDQMEEDALYSCQYSKELNDDLFDPNESGLKK